MQSQIDIDKVTQSIILTTSRQPANQKPISEHIFDNETNSLLVVDLFD